MLVCSSLLAAIGEVVMKKAVVTESAAAAVVESEVVTVAAKGLVKSIMGGVRVRVLKHD